MHSCFVFLYIGVYRVVSILEAEIKCRALFINGLVQEINVSICSGSIDFGDLFVL